jgi:hypothetical protein
VNRHVIDRHLGRAGLTLGVPDPGPERQTALDQVSAGYQRIERRVEGLAGNGGEKADSAQIDAKDGNFLRAKETRAPQQGPVSPKSDEGIQPGCIELG